MSALHFIIQHNQYTAQSMTARSTNTILRATLYQMNYFLARGDLDL